MLAIAALLALAAAPVAEIAAPGPAGPLHGVATGIDGARRPIVLMIPGSGPTDRDGNNPLGVKGGPYRLLAEALAGQGIASVRVDKRGLFASLAAVADPNAVTLADYAHDVRSWVDAIGAKTGARCIWVLGHSEGGLVALRAAADSAEGMCGLVLVSTGGRPAGEVLKEQLRASPAAATLAGPGAAAVDALAAGRRVDTAGMPPALATLFHPAVQGLLMSEFAADPARLIAGLRLPVLIVQGERDIQVSVDDARRLAAADPAARLVLLPDTNHVLKRVTSADRAANVAAYADPALPLAPGVAEAIARFVTARAR